MLCHAWLSLSCLEDALIVSVSLIFAAPMFKPWVIRADHGLIIGCATLEKEHKLIIV